MVRKSLVEDRLDELRPRGYKILLEIIGRLRPSLVVDVPYVFGERAGGQSKLGFRTILDYVVHVLELNEWRIVKNAIVGVSGIGVLWLTLYLLTDIMGIRALLAYPVAIEASILNNFFWNDIWVFRKRRKGGARGFLARLGKYHLAVALGAIVNYSLFALLHGVLGLEKYLSSLIGIGSGWAANYLFSEQVVWEANVRKTATLSH